MTGGQRRKELIEWISAGLEKDGKSKAGLAKALQRAPSVVSMILNGKRKIAADELPVIARYLGSPAPDVGDYVRTEPLVSSFDPDAPDMYVDPDSPKFSRDFPEGAVIELLSRAGLGDGETPEIVYRRDGDEFTTVDAIKDDYWRFPASFINQALTARPERIIVLECDGDSMEPTIHPGERVIVDTSHRQPTPDGLYAIRDALGAIIVKRLELTPTKPPKVRILSDNPRHGSYEIGPEDLAIVGKVKCGLRLL